jgi:hypothetical protein
MNTHITILEFISLSVLFILVYALVKTIVDTFKTPKSK